MSKFLCFAARNTICEFPIFSVCKFSASPLVMVEFAKSGEFSA